MRLRSVLFWLLLAALLVPAGLLTYARWAQPPGGTWLRVVAFTPWAIPAYAAAVGLLLVRGVLPGRGLRLLWLLGALALLAPLAVHLWWFSPQLVGANPPPARDAAPLTVLTVNSLRGEVDALALVEAATTADADLLVVEETTPGELATLERGGLAEGWPYRAGQPQAGVDGTMVFSRLRLGRAERIATTMDSWAVTVSTDTGDLRLLAVHVWPPTAPARWRADHHAIRVAAPGADLVVGDLNATPDHQPVQVLAALGLRSVAELANEGWQPTWPANGEQRVLGVGLPPLVQIDHVLVGERLAALSTRTVAIDGTDHLAVVAEVAFQ